MESKTQDKKFNSVRYRNDFIFDNADNIRLDKTVKLIGKNKLVLDVGCGDGFIMNMIRNLGNKVIGIEIADSAIKKARKKGFKVYDLSLNSNWSGKIQEKFDVIFAGEIIEHIFDTDQFLSNIRKVLKKNGKLIITTPNLATLGRRLMLFVGQNPLIETTGRSTDAGHIRYFTQGSLCMLLRENGFRVHETTSAVVNFNSSGKIFSKLMATIFPTLGNNIIVYASKEKQSVK